MKPRLGAVWWLAAAAIAALLLALVPVGVWNPVWTGPGRFVGGIEGGRLEFAWSDTAIKRDHDGWLVRSPVSEAIFGRHTGSAWKPRVVTLRPYMFIAGAPKSSTLTMVSVPLWPWVVVLGLAAFVLRMFAPRRGKPGTCRRCGYDVTGLVGQICPECGDPHRVGAISIPTSLVKPQP